MATSVVPSLIDALYTNAVTALPNVQVYDGFGLSEDPNVQALMVGVDDPDAKDAAHAADAMQEWANANYTARNETGYILCAAVAWDGNAVAKTARDNAYAIVAGVENMCRANPSLGVANLLWTSVGGRMVLSQNQTENGSAALIVFRVNFRARI